MYLLISTLLLIIAMVATTYKQKAAAWIITGVSLIPLLLDMNTAKAVFIWLGLVSFVYMTGILVQGSFPKDKSSSQK